MKRIKLAELEIPVNYFSFTDEEKKALCTEVMDAMLHMLDKQLNPAANRMVVLDRLLESSIMTNVEEEQYEIAGMLNDIRNLINE
jgi:hypothetical protein